MLFSNKSIEKLNAAFEIYNMELCDSLPHDYELENITFSESFDSKMQKLLKLEQKPYFYMINTVGKRVAIIILSVLIALTATTFSVKALREAVIDFITETFKTHTKISVNVDETPQQKNVKKVCPHYIPQGYEIESELDFGTMYRIIFNNDQNNPIEYNQKFNYGTSYNANTENIEYERIQINSLDGISYTKDECRTVIFADEVYYYTIQGNASIEELIKMAESIPITQNGFVKMQPLYIPDGYTIEEEINDCISIYSITYNNEANKPIVYDQIITLSTGYSINTEDAECETVYINSFEGMTIVKNEYTTVVFSDGEYYYTLVGRALKEELIKMAESIPIPQEGFIKMKPQYIPEDFTVSEENDNEEFLRIVYRNSENVPISYSQQINDDSSFTTDTEGTDFETIYINSFEGIKYTNKGFNKIVFGNEQYFFTIDGKVAMEELIKMAESISITQDGFKKLSPMYLPKNFVVYNENYTEDVSYLLEYRNNYGNKLRMVQGNNDDSVNVNTEDAKVENIYINSLEGIKYKDNNGYNNVVFANKKYHFIITGNIDMEEIIKVAESIPIE